MSFQSVAIARPFRIAVGLVAVLAVAGCSGFSSDDPLVGKRDMVSPFSGSQGLVIRGTSKNTTTRMTLERTGSDYTIEAPEQGMGKIPVRFFDLSLKKGGSNIYGVQMWEEGKPANYGYVTVQDAADKRQSSAGALYVPSATAEMLKNARITFREARTDSFWFDSYDDLRAGLRQVALEGAMELTARYQASPRSSPPGAGMAFSESGYRHPKLLAAIHRGNKGDRDLNVQGLYLQTFLEMFTNTTEVPGCRDVISIRAHTKLTGIGIADGFRKALGPWIGAHQKGSDGRDDALADGAGAGVQGFLSAGTAEANGKHDAQVFFRRHGCTSKTARQFFDNFERVLLAL